ncbi:MAG: hypothetical protein U9R38_01850 [Candidatus Margulisiibacteriota bacterium]|nr:hypothetical protein [Candidatus Margulisiibacteriota bacterium]
MQRLISKGLKCIQQNRYFVFKQTNGGTVKTELKPMRLMSDRTLADWRGRDSIGDLRCQNWNILRSQGGDCVNVPIDRFAAGENVDAEIMTFLFGLVEGYTLHGAVSARIHFGTKEARLIRLLEAPWNLGLNPEAAEHKGLAVNGVSWTLMGALACYVYCIDPAMEISLVIYDAGKLPFYKDVVGAEFEPGIPLVKNMPHPGRLYGERMESFLNRFLDGEQANIPG